MPSNVIDGVDSMIARMAPWNETREARLARERRKLGNPLFWLRGIQRELRGPDEPVDTDPGQLGDQIWRALNLGFATLAAYVIGTWLVGLFVAPREPVSLLGGLGESFSELAGSGTFDSGFFGLIRWTAKVGFAFVLPLVVIRGILQKLPDALARFIGYGVIATLATAALITDERAPAADPVSTEAPRTREELTADYEALQAVREEAAEAAAKAARLERTAALQKVDELSARVARAWRADLIAAGAAGARGEIPPLLEVQHLEAGQLQVTNRGERSLCLAAAHIERDARGEVRSRCALGGRNCQIIDGHATRTLRPYLPGIAPACRAKEIEFRIGSMREPEPSWWTRTALDGSTDQSFIDERDYASMPLELLKAEIALLESLERETLRAERWHRELAALRSK
jgi:hypothetical protein